MDKIVKVIFTFLSTLIFCYFADKFNCYNVLIVYMLVTLWYELVLDRDSDKE